MTSYILIIHDQDISAIPLFMEKILCTFVNIGILGMCGLFSIFAIISSVHTAERGFLLGSPHQPPPSLGRAAFLGVIMLSHLIGAGGSGWLLWLMATGGLLSPQLHNPHEGEQEWPRNFLDTVFFEA